MLRFSLGTLFLFILLVSFASAALGSGSENWRIATVSACILSLLAATVAGVSGRGQLSIYARGFAITGGLYFALLFGSAFPHKSQLLTDAALVHLHQYSTPETQYTEQVASDLDLVFAQPPTAPYTAFVNAELGLVQIPESYRQIGHACWAMTIGFIGGLAACGLHRWTTRPAPIANGAESGAVDESLTKDDE
ncbi:MAG: hypothetical protein QGG36_16570 [Pirellulaceae bacterium]|jgi:hypothetical protein|nr:hypothetical protein [Pirellulaceae bacterium]MDP7017421.1 hypothetical protein [Pirellulaceae bacterium]